VLRTLHIRSKHLLVLLVFGFMSLALAGCGDSGLPFVDAPEVSFFEESTSLIPGGVATAALVLDKPAPRSFSVGLFGIDDAGLFQFPSSVRVSSGQSTAVFVVEASIDAGANDNLTLRILPGNDYVVPDFEPDELVVRVAGSQIPSVSLVGPDQAVSPGGQASFSVVRTVGLGEVSVSILVTPGSEGFSIPQAVTFLDGELSQTFVVGVGGDVAENESIDIYILAPDGYLLSEPFQARVTVGAR